ncbi:MAG: hypothetical protein GY953_36130, partial [bacterium]|nr:hypothetical protein [bacterium]
DVSEYFTGADGELRASLWEFDLDGLREKGNRLRAETVSGATSVTFDVETERALYIQDDWGIPHIYAFNEEMMHFAMAYAQADDNHLATLYRNYMSEAGRGMEQTGLRPARLLADYKMRYRDGVGAVSRNYDKIPEWSRRNIEAFAAGINQYAASPPEETPRGFEPVTPHHIFSYGRKPVSSRVEFGAQMQLEYGNAAAELGEDLWRRFHMGFKIEPVVYWKENTRAETREHAALPAPGGAGFSPLPPETLRSLSDWHNLTALENNATVIAVTKDLATDGQPLFATSLMYPRIDKNAYEMHVRAPGIDAMGQVNLGDTRFVYGFSRGLAWGGSTYRSAASDMYIEKVRVNETGEPTHYLLKDEWLPVERRETTLRIAKKGGGFSTLDLPLFSTGHGGLIPLTEGTGQFYTRLKGGPKIRWAE